MLQTNQDEVSQAEVPPTQLKLSCVQDLQKSQIITKSWSRPGLSRTMKPLFYDLWLNSQCALCGEPFKSMQSSSAQLSRALRMFKEWSNAQFQNANKSHLRSHHQTAKCLMMVNFQKEKRSTVFPEAYTQMDFPFTTHFHLHSIWKFILRTTVSVSLTQSWWGCVPHQQWWWH